MNQPVQQSIEQKLKNQFTPLFMQIMNESHMHSVPPNSETHFKVVLVSALFEGKRPVARHQLVYKALAEDMAGPVHALALHTYTHDEWKQIEDAPDSPKCLGGSKANG